MLLVIDVGNTNTKFGCIEAEGLAFKETIKTDKTRSEFEYVMMLDKMFSMHGIEAAKLEGCVLSSVVPGCDSAIMGAVLKLTGKVCLKIAYDIDMDFTNALDDPSEIGADLICGCQGALTIAEPPLAVVDTGTCTKIMIIDENYQFRGGIIHPGISTVLETLHRSTALLPEQTADSAPSVIGAGTKDAISSGALYGHAGMIDSILVRMEYELGSDLDVILTGGMADMLKPLCGHPMRVDKDLLLRGMLSLYYKNQDRTGVPVGARNVMDGSVSKPR